MGKKSEIKTTKIAKGLMGLSIVGLLGINLYNLEVAKELKMKNTKLKEDIAYIEQDFDKKEKEYNILISNKNKELKENQQTIEEQDTKIDKLKKTYTNLNISPQQVGVSSRGGQTIDSWITVNASAYTNAPEENGGYSTTALGDPLVFGMVAVDPNFLPLGTRIMIDGFGNTIFKCSDTGGAIKGNRIDILLNSKTEAMNFGRQQVRVKVVNCQLP